MVKHIPNNHDDSIWVKLRKEFTGEERDIYLGTCYISPLCRTKNSVDIDVRHASLEKFFTEARQFNSKGEVIMQGDFNARVGNLPDFITKDKYDDIFGI